MGFSLTETGTFWRGPVWDLNEGLLRQSLPTKIFTPRYFHWLSTKGPAQEQEEKEGEAEYADTGRPWATGGKEGRICTEGILVGEDEAGGRHGFASPHHHSADALRVGFLQDEGRGEGVVDPLL